MAAIAVTVLCGPDGRLRAQALQTLATARPAAERWAVLRNGVVWPTAPQQGLQHLACYDAGAACGCCIGHVALRVTLARLLRDASRARAPWDALIAELGPGVHPQAFVELLGAAAFAGHFAVARRIVVLDPAAAARTLAAPASDAARMRLAAQLSAADELLLEPVPAVSEAVAALRAAAAQRCRVSWLQACGTAQGGCDPGQAD